MDLKKLLFLLELLSIFALNEYVLKRISFFLFCVLLIQFNCLSQPLIKSSFSIFSSFNTNSNLIINSNQSLVGKTANTNEINHGYLPLNRFFLTLNQLENTDFFLYPNPSHSAINIKSSENLTGELNIYGLSGNLVYSNNYVTNISQLNIDFLANGVYYLNFIYNDQVIFNEKIIKL